MIDISFAGLVGAILGTIVAAACYGTLVDAFERWLAGRRAPEDPPASKEELALLRRAILAIDIIVFGAVGYWIGHEIGG
ncbi:MAG: hypothetical protein QOG83_3172 [Alphaproteobacteria bacterium]|jgi:hypothetical protein|nr:hypothetical protein [Alphaproteobacteria bacterium]MEA2937678.1 hypothetical protein [Alphaproteobacteria bacterium]MEA2990461.1 hypothetical protein [Alphaproteobacteria bacterium]